jgi:hypothetical protein
LGYLVPPAASTRLSRRDSIQLPPVVATSAIALDSGGLLAKPSAAERRYGVPPFGNVSFLHCTDRGCSKPRCRHRVLPGFRWGAATLAGEPLTYIYRSAPPGMQGNPDSDRPGCGAVAAPRFS